MNRRPPPQLLLPFPSQLPEGALPPPIQQRCNELLTQLLMQVVMAELHRSKEASDEREDPIQTS